MSIRLPGYFNFARVVVVVFGGIAATTNSAVAASSPWMKIETSEVVIYSDAPPKQIVECTVRYLAFRRAFSDLFVAPGSSLQPSVLIVFRTAKSFQAKIPSLRKAHTETVNYSAEIDGTPLNAFAYDGDLDRALTLTFEFETISALRRLGYHLPIWMSQGAGEVLATLSLAKGQCLVGERGDHPFNEVFEWPHFFAIGETAKVYNDVRQLADYLGQAWGLMHWVLLQDPGTRERFTAIALRLQHASALQAVTAEMNTEADQLSRTILRHLAHTKTRRMPFDEAAERSRLQAQPASEAEVLVQMTNLIGATGQLALSDEQLDRARALDPHLPAVNEADARRLDREGQHDEALRFYREAIAGGSKNVMAYLRSANARLDDLRTGGRDVAGEGGTLVQPAVDELRQAIKLAPGNAEAYRLLGRAFFVRPKISEAEVAELSVGLGTGESGGAVRYYRALLYARLGQTKESHADLAAIAGDESLSDQLRHGAKSRLTSEVVKADAEQIEGFLADKNYAAARGIVQAAAAAGYDPDAARVYQQLGTVVDVQEAANGLEELAEGEKWPELLAAAEKFCLKFPASERTPRARELLATARQH